MADYKLWKTIGRVVKKPGQIVLIVLTVAAVPLAWVHVLAHYWESGVLTVVVVLFLSALWELHQETRGHQDGPSPSEMAKIPDFTRDFLIANEMLSQQKGDAAQVDQWVQGVYTKLVAWNLSAAEKFRPVALVETPESQERRAAWFKENGDKSYGSRKGLINSLLKHSPPSIENDPQLERLKRYRDRLIEIVSPS
jgi:hypothetical protein